MDIWSTGHLVNWTFGQLDIWSSGHLVKWTFGQMDEKAQHPVVFEQKENQVCSPGPNVIKLLTVEQMFVKS